MSDSLVPIIIQLEDDMMKITITNVKTVVMLELIITVSLHPVPSSSLNNMKVMHCLLEMLIVDTCYCSTAHLQLLQFQD